jgi:uncharacterized protein (DUF433 family)
MRVPSAASAPERDRPSGRSSTVTDPATVTSADKLTNRSAAGTLFRRAAGQSHLRRARAGRRVVGKANYRERIIRDPGICGGEPVIKGTRVTLRTVLASLSDGDSIETIVKAFPTLTEDDVRAVVAFAAESAREDLPAPRPMIP